MRISLASLPVVALLVCGAAHAQAGPDMCKGVDAVVAAASGKGLPSLASGWKDKQSYAAVAKPTGMARANECQVVRGGKGGRDQFDCLWTYMASPDSANSTISRWAKDCLTAKGWKADPPQNEGGATIVRMTLAGSQVEVLGIEVGNGPGGVSRSERLSVTAPAK